MKNGSNAPKKDIGNGSSKVTYDQRRFFNKFYYLEIKAFTILIRKDVRMESIWATI
jgi:hypothetical protein